MVAEQAQTGQKFTTTTNSSGQYLLPQLPIGTYSLKVNATNFKQSVLSNVEVHVGDSLRHDFTIQIGDANETVVVEADSGAVQPESAEIKDVVLEPADRQLASEDPPVPGSRDVEPGRGAASRRNSRRRPAAGRRRW